MSFSVGYSHSSSYVDDHCADRVLRVWRSSGPDLAFSQLLTEYRNGHDGALLSELHRRLLGDNAPRILIDGIWLSSCSVGGIYRVWQQILSTCSLPGMCTPNSPITYLNRSNIGFNTFSFPSIRAPFVNPHDLSLFTTLAQQNNELVVASSADIFCSSWISTSGVTTPSCLEVALVHDCIPELYTPQDPLLLPLRKRWILGSSTSLSVSQDTSNQLASFYDLPFSHDSWCHLAPDSTFYQVSHPSNSFELLQDIFLEVGLSPPYILLPGSGLIGSYKNPDIVAKALCHHELSNISLLITGVNSSAIRDSILSLYPSLSKQVFIAGFSDSELSVVYRHALAVVMPSLIEGFGLPVVEALASGGLAIISDVFGLREAGSEATLRFDPFDETQLIDILKLLLINESRDWLSSKLNYRSHQRLQRLNPDLIGLALLTQCRLSFNRF